MDVASTQALETEQKIRPNGGIVEIFEAIKMWSITLSIHISF